MKIWMKISAAFSIMILLLVGVSVFNYFSFKTMEQKSDDIVLDAIPIGTAASSLLSNLIDQETGIRGYLVTGDKSFLEPYENGTAALQKNLTTIRQYEAQHPIMKDLVENQALPQIQKLDAYFKSQIQLVEEGKIDVARQKIADGKEQMDAFRQINQEILADVQKLTNDSWNASKASAARSNIVMLSGSIVSVIVAILAALMLTRAIVTPLQTVNNQLRDIADGEGDLTREISVQAKDETGDLAVSFNRMLANLRELIRQVSANTEQVAASAEQLNAGADESSRAAEQIAVTIQEVASGTEKQVDGINTTVHLVGEVSAEVAQIAAYSQTVTTTTVSASEKAQEGNTSIQSAVKQMHATRETVDGAAAVITELGNHSKEIGNITAVITSIAAQTNLLALNASIEAARAGDHGKGFAVVADEVRKLAEQSANATKQISELITKVQNETNAAVQSMQHVTKEVATGLVTVNEAGSAFETIYHTVTEAVKQVQQVSKAAKQIAAKTEQMESSINIVAGVAEVAAASTQHVTNATEEQLASMEEIFASSSSLTKMAEELQELVGKFKV